MDFSFTFVRSPGKLHLQTCVRLFLLFLLTACSSERETEQLPDKNKITQTATGTTLSDKRPNFLIILADDLGYSDIGIMGSEIKTPNIDRLASQGMLMTNFNVHMACSPTRAMMLSGVDSHIAGYGTMAGEFTEETRGQPGYETFLSDRVTTIAEILKTGGYHTYIAGKWDMGGHGNPALWPDKRGFEESFVLVEGSGSHFNKAPPLLELTEVTYVENGKEIDLPEDFYSSKNYADKLIEYVDKNKADGKPFFAYLPFTAPHYPLQAPDEFIEKYAGVYEEGYEVIRAERVKRMRAAGLIDQKQIPAEQHPLWPKWDALDAPMKIMEVKRMQIYAAMVEAMDFHIGRVLAHLERNNQLENTFILFLSDNGAEGGNPHDWYGQAAFDWAEKLFDVGVDNMGRSDSYVWLGPGWAHVSSTPLRYFKGFPTEGGTRTPAIFKFPGHIKAGTRSEAFANLLDIPVTLLDYAGIVHPGIGDNGEAMPAPAGSSMRTFLSGSDDAIHKSEDYFAYVIFGRRGLVQGEWKMTWMNSPWGPQGQWSLFNLSDDPAEKNDLSKAHPEKVAELEKLWDEYVVENGVIPVEEYKMGWTNAFSHYQWLPAELRSDSSINVLNTQ